MQNVLPTGLNNPNNHTKQEIIDALVGKQGTRKLTYFYYLLDKDNVYIREMAEVLSCSVNQDWLADIKRTASFRIQDQGRIDYSSNRIQPWVRLHIPPYGPDDYAQWPQGVFLPSSPTRSTDDAEIITRDVEAYDPLQVFADDLVTARYAVAAGAVVTTGISTLLGSIPKSVVASTKTLPTAKEWEPGTSKLSIINELCSSINYNSLSFDEYGTAIVSPYQTPAERGAEWTYADDSASVLSPNVSQTLDLFNIPNKWVLLVSDPDRIALISSYTNQSPTSPTSTVRRGRTIVDFRQEENAVDQAALDAKAARYAFEASQVFEAIEFKTALMPFHSGNDVYNLAFEPLGINGKYSEQSWTMTFEPGAMMGHRARRVVTV